MSAAAKSGTPPAAPKEPTENGASSVQIFDDIAAFTAVAGAGPLIGLDLGTKTIGVAVSDPGRLVATPVETIKRRKFRLDAERLLHLAAERDVVGVVLGLPRNMDGSEGPRAQSTRAFARNLAALTQHPIVFWDERLSTAAVERMLIAADASRARRAEVIDKTAAAYILQGALDRLRLSAERAAANAAGRREDPSA